MHAEQLRFEPDGKSRWAGMGDYLLVSPDGRHSIAITYVGEPPHGDSYHTVNIDGSALPGYAWGCMYAFSKCSRYCAFSWMKKLYERRTIVVDLQNRTYCTPGFYFHHFEIQWPSILNEDRDKTLSHYTFTGQEVWRTFPES